MNNKLKFKLRKLINKSNKRIFFIITLAVLGIIGLVNIRASSFNVSLEPESGNLTNGAKITNDSSASNGKFVKFNSLSQGGTPTFVDDFNGTEVDTTKWQVAGWYEHTGQTSPERAYVANGKLNLVLRYEPPDDNFLSSAIQTWDKNQFGYGTWEASLKPTTCPGVLNSMYTIDWDEGNGSKEEIDIEFLTKSFNNNYGEIHYAVHESEPVQTSWDTNPDIPLGFNPSSGFRTYGFTVTKDKIEWFVDNKNNVIKRYIYAEDSNGALSINNNYQFKFNVWSQHGQWIGGPPPANTDCVYQIDWVKFTPIT